jgi:pimeloyl-ACP methyl ester carboxylesterase
MAIEEQIQTAYKLAANYPDLVKRLIAIGVEGYTVEVSIGIILYRFANGVTHIHLNSNEPAIVARDFSEVLTIKAIRDNQQGKTDYRAFMSGIAQAGVRFYEATFVGNKKRVTYIGVGGYYEELIPV